MATASPGRYDPGARRRMLRKGREKGGSIYIPLEELAKTGRGGAGEPVYYRVWGAERGRVVVQLYATK